MNRVKNLWIGYAVVVLIVASANFANPSILYVGAWIILVTLGILNAVITRRSKE